MWKQHFVQSFYLFCTYYETWDNWNSERRSNLPQVTQPRLKPSFSMRSTIKHLCPGLWVHICSSKFELEFGIDSMLSFPSKNYFTRFQATECLNSRRLEFSPARKLLHNFLYSELSQWVFRAGLWCPVWGSSPKLQLEKFLSPTCYPILRTFYIRIHQQQGCTQSVQFTCKWDLGPLGSSEFLSWRWMCYHSVSSNVWSSFIVLFFWYHLISLTFVVCFHPNLVVSFLSLL